MAFVYTTSPFHPNIKCIIFGMMIMALYWFSASPENRNIYIVTALFFISYILMAWYDYIYECNRKLYSGEGGVAAMLDSIFKPQEWDYAAGDDPATPDPDAPEKHPDQRKVYNRYVYLFHILLVAPLLIYVGLRHKTMDPKIYSLVLIMGITALSYHGLRLFI